MTILVSQYDDKVAHDLQGILAVFLGIWAEKMAIVNFCG